MADEFTALLDSELDLSKAEKSLQDFLDKCQKPIKLNLDIGGLDKASGINNIGKQIEQQVGKQVKTAGTTVGKIFNESWAKTASKNISGQFGISNTGIQSEITAQIKNLIQQGKNVAQSSGSDRKVQSATYNRMTDILFDTIKNSATPLTQKDDSLDDFYNYFKDKKIYISDQLKKSLISQDRWKEVFQSLPGKITTNPSKGFAIDMSWDEIREAAGGALDNIGYSEEDQLLSAINLFKKARDTHKNGVSLGRVSDDDIWNAIGELSAQITQNSINQPKTTSPQYSGSIQDRKKLERISLDDHDNPAQYAKEYYSNMSDVAKVSVSEIRDEESALESFIVTATKTNGVIEKLKYQFQEGNGSLMPDSFNYVGGSINDSNADKVATSLRTKDFDTVKAVQSEKLDTFINRIEKSNVPIENMQSEIDSLRTSLNGAFDKSSLTAFLNELDIAIAKHKTLSSQIAADNKNEIVGIKSSALESQIEDLKNISPGIENFKTSILDADVSIDTLLDDLSRVNSTGDISVVTQRFNAFKDAAKAAGYQVKETVDDLASMTKINKMRDSVNNGSFDAFTSKADKALSAYSGQDSAELAKARTYLEEIKKLQSEIKQNYANEEIGLNFDPTEQDSKIRELEDAVQKYNNSMIEVKASMSRSVDSSVGEIGYNKVKAYMQENSKAVKKYGAELEALAEQYRNVKTAQDKLDVDNAYKKLTSQISAEGLTGKSGFDSFKQALGKISQFVGIYGVIQNLVMEVPSKMVSAVKDINAAQIELQKVSDASTSELSKYWDEAAASAKKYGATIDDVISSTADWSRLGYNLDDAKKLSDATTLMQRVGDNMTQESSSKGIIATLKGFQMDADEVMKIDDIINEVANTQPIDTAGLFEGLERSASSMSAANNSLEQTVALLTAANSVVQDPDSVGTALKTISMRIRGAKTELEDASLDTDGMADSVSKLREELLALSGVDIMKNDDTFKSTYDILDELAQKWSDLSDIQQANVTELIAGIVFYPYVQKCA